MYSFLAKTEAFRDLLVHFRAALIAFLDTHVVKKGALRKRGVELFHLENRNNMIEGVWMDTEEATGDQTLLECQIDLVFGMDPPQCFRGDSHRKGFCFQDRRLQKAEQIEQLSRDIKYSLGTSSCDPVAPGTPTTTTRVGNTLLQTNGRFPFAREKLRGVLGKHDIAVKTASQEADEELCALVRSGKAFAVLGEDSDFLVMKDLRYVPFGNSRSMRTRTVQGT
ncbi:hypothetical protein PsorP6_006555 [Peronosclerospora sorghi]|uniref:Uncharacterized protein n=1 Tax=Peronosclerospora sorghi TaxID=230839 RepID=A0ACC0W3D1_9STRA|nr:hypothetical protein PsorP6_006555 [Peronosclerospora sorghi]